MTVFEVVQVKTDKLDMPARTLGHFVSRDLAEKYIDSVVDFSYDAFRIVEIEVITK